MPTIINIVSAKSNTGKTTIIENIIPFLKKKDLKIAVLKGNPHHYDLDTHGKDSWRFTKAGANISGITTSNEYLLFASELTENGVTAAIKRLPDVDLIIIEGDKNSNNPKFEVMRSDIYTKPMLKNKTIALISDLNNLELNIPVIGIDHYEEIANFMYNLHLGNDTTNNHIGNLTHFDHKGRPHMVDVSAKEETMREAYACSEITMKPITLKNIQDGTIQKGDVLSIAQVAAISAVKETFRLIPLAHPLLITGVSVNFEINEQYNTVQAFVRVKSKGQTGVEMEALTGASIATLTIYDMCKAIDKNMVINNTRLIEKKGGRSGHFIHEQI